MSSYTEQPLEASTVVWADGGVIVTTSYSEHEGANATTVRRLFATKAAFLRHCEALWEQNKTYGHL